MDGLLASAAIQACRRRRAREYRDEGVGRDGEGRGKSALPDADCSDAERQDEVAQAQEAARDGSAECEPKVRDSEERWDAPPAGRPSMDAADRSQDHPAADHHPWAAGEKADLVVGQQVAGAHRDWAMVAEARARTEPANPVGQTACSSRQAAAAVADRKLLDLI